MEIVHVQIVLDKKLLRAADQVARPTKRNRSALVRDALREHLQRLAIRDLEECDRAGYSKRRQSRDEASRSQVALKLKYHVERNTILLKCDKRGIHEAILDPRRLSLVIPTGPARSPEDVLLYPIQDPQESREVEASPESDKVELILYCSIGISRPESRIKKSRWAK